MTTHRAIGFAAIAACVNSSLARADDLHVSSVHFDQGDWIFVPLYSTSSETVDVSHLIAIPKPGVTFAENLNAVWYSLGETGWNGFAWSGLTTAQAVRQVKLALAMDDSDDGLWTGLSGIASVPDEAMITPSSYANGMLSDDPLYVDVMASSNPAALVSELTTLGYMSAVIDVDQIQIECDANTVLNSFEDAAVWAATESIVDDASAAAATETMAAMLAVCIPPVICTPGPVTAWVVTAWVPAACNWVYLNSSSTPTTGGALVTCNYESRRYYTQTRSCTYLKADCTTYTCTQQQTGYNPVAGSCGPVSVPTGTTYSCPGAPSCLGSPGPACGLLPPPAVITYTWGPACPE